jgi:hypothetical protein
MNPNDDNAFFLRIATCRAASWHLHAGSLGAFVNRQRAVSHRTPALKKLTIVTMCLAAYLNNCSSSSPPDIEIRRRSEKGSRCRRHPSNEFATSIRRVAQPAQPSEDVAQKSTSNVHFLIDLTVIADEEGTGRAGLYRVWFWWIYWSRKKRKYQQSRIA